MSEDESYKKFLARIRAILWVWFFSTPTIIFTYIVDEIPISLSILAFAIIISLTLLKILRDDKQNLTRNLDILSGNEGIKDTSNEEAENPSNEQVVNSINLPEDYNPKAETKQITNTINLGGNDLGKEIATTALF